MLNASEGFVLLRGSVFARARGQAQSPQFDPPGGGSLLTLFPRPARRSHRSRAKRNVWI